MRRLPPSGAPLGFDASTHRSRERNTAMGWMIPCHGSVEASRSRGGDDRVYSDRSRRGLLDALCDTGPLLPPLRGWMSLERRSRRPFSAEKPARAALAAIRPGQVRLNCRIGSGRSRCAGCAGTTTAKETPWPASSSARIAPSARNARPAATVRGANRNRHRSCPKAPSVG